MFLSCIFYILMAYKVREFWNYSSPSCPLHNNTAAQTSIEPAVCSGMPQVLHCFQVRRRIVPLCSAWCCFNLSTGCSFGQCNIRKIQNVRKHLNGGYKDGKGSRGQGVWGAAEVSGFSTEQLSGGLMTSYRSLQGPEGTAELCSLSQWWVLREWHGAVSGGG